MPSVVLVVFDLETTSLSNECEITQISASSLDRTDTFDRYVLPVGPISKDASKVTHITKRNIYLTAGINPIMQGSSICMRQE